MTTSAKFKYLAVANSSEQEESSVQEQTAPAAQNQQIDRNGQPFEKADYWFNIGTLMPQTLDDGTVEQVFVAVLGVPFKGFKDPRDKEARTHFAKVLQGRKLAMISKWQDCIAKLEPGETTVFGQAPYQIEIRRVGQTEVADPAQDPDLDALLALM